jgi:hypothetical protein
MCRMRVGHLVDVQPLPSRATSRKHASLIYVLAAHLALVMDMILRLPVMKTWIGFSTVHLKSTHEGRGHVQWVRNCSLDVGADASLPMSPSQVARPECFLTDACSRQGTVADTVRRTHARCPVAFLQVPAVELAAPDAGWVGVNGAVAHRCPRDAQSSLSNQLYGFGFFSRVWSRTASARPMPQACADASAGCGSRPPPRRPRRSQSHAICHRVDTCR